MSGREMPLPHGLRESQAATSAVARPPVGPRKPVQHEWRHSPQKELADKGVRVQTVLPGATATEFWDIAGYAPQKTSATTMSAENCVDAALAGLDAGELVTIPGLHDGELWVSWEADRRKISPKFGNAKPAPRYGVGSRVTGIA